MSDSELTQEEAERIVQKVLDDSAKVLGHNVMPNEIQSALETLAETKYTTECDNFIDLETSDSEEAAQASGRGRFMPFFLASLRRYLCGDKEAAAKIQEAVEEAKTHSPSINIGVPASTGISAGGAAIVYIAVSSALAGTAIAAAAPPLVAGVALIIFLSGFDSFCQWSKPGGGEGSSPEKN